MIMEVQIMLTETDDEINKLIESIGARQNEIVEDLEIVRNARSELGPLLDSIIDRQRSISDELASIVEDRS